MNLNIVHIDLNSCFATSMQQAYFHLRGKPVVAAAYETDRGCVLSPSIEAKTYGIKTGMRVFEARKLCPNLIVRMTETGLVRDIHLKFKKICQEYTPLVSPLSIDEMVLNFSPVGKIQEKTLVELGREIKQRIKYEIGDWMRCNVGISLSRFLAKVAAGLHKPDGLDVIAKRDIPEIFKSLTLIDLPGINIRYQARLNAADIFTPLDLYNASALKLKKQAFRSINGYYWYARMRGIEVDGVDWQRKSYGQDYALQKKTDDPKEIEKLLMKLCEKMGRRLRRAGYGAQGIHVGCLYADHTYWNHGRKLSHVMYTTKDLFSEALRNLKEQTEKKVLIKLMVRCFDLLPGVSSQISLFDRENKQGKVADALDILNDKYGEFTVVPALMMDMNDTVLDRIAFGNVRELNHVHVGIQ
ncbi:MAG: DNA-directed DNA polymerase [Candidatus Roizmanbacteria bacterium GW2011_GWB1_40_7]|uniref:DNA-directed DNA polymerase n=2 Tax=Candidatus Roizmaniibacteriota TaxID=1752723 RepID=A0A0G0X889_9BACT|nr:MAG: DNA-directed DNA polymerase [Candidatus Roizmanbacteria bacterium GW2011_GWB1_40_7]KKS21269.1 MAG: DNA-directed DNA polymerase [Candidatus Roizmanbacteria bacterium GW2011_GWC2_41_7]